MGRLIDWYISCLLDNSLSTTGCSLLPLKYLEMARVWSLIPTTSSVDVCAENIFRAAYGFNPVNDFFR
jgi:hypothetical protein